MLRQFASLISASRSARPTRRTSARSRLGIGFPGFADRVGVPFSVAFNVLDFFGGHIVRKDLELGVRRGEIRAELAAFCASAVAG